MAKHILLGTHIVQRLVLLVLLSATAAIASLSLSSQNNDTSTTL
jgi:hypothetical protein